MMHWYQSPFKSIHDTGPTRVNALGVRSKAVLLPCMGPNYNYVLISRISYPSNTAMWAAFQKGDPKVRCTIQKHRQPGMGDDLTVADHLDAKNYAESIGFGDGGIDASSESYFDGPWKNMHDAGPTRLFAIGVRIHGPFFPCVDPNYDFVMFSNISYPSNKAMWVAFMKGDPAVGCTIQKVRQPGMGDDVTDADYQDAINYSKSIGFGEPVPTLLEQVGCCRRRKQA